MREILNRALELPSGEQLVLTYRDKRTREQARRALFAEIRKTRLLNRKAYDPSEPAWDTTPWDDVMIFREGETQIVLARATDLQPVNIEQVSHVRS